VVVPPPVAVEVAVGVAARNPLPPPPLPQNDEVDICPVCLRPEGEVVLRTLYRCPHKICVPCFVQIWDMNVDNNRDEEFLCPLCREPL